MMIKGVATKLGNISQLRSSKPVKRPVMKTAAPKNVNKKKANASGASRVANNEARFTFDMPQWDSVFSKINSLLNARVIIAITAVSILLFAAYAFFVAVESVMGVAVENVKIQGQLHYQTEAEIGDIINRYTSDGFVNVDLADLHAELEALPWIYSVFIKRQLPNDLIISLKEQQAIATWNEHSVINNYGQVFTPKSPVLIPGLVQFKGKHHDKVLAMYKRVEKLLPSMQKPIKSLLLNDRQIVHITLQSGSKLIISGDDVDRQLMRWNKIVARADVQQLNDIKQADLRYSNGAAVSWKSGTDSRKKVLGNR